MGNGEALQLALALHEQPARAAEFRARALPSGITEVLRVASGNAASIAAAAERCGVDSGTVVDAARFYVEQQLLARECEHDPWRVLGVSPDAEPDLIRDHRRLLMGLVHPDRGQDWAAAFSDRVNRAWRELKTPEGRLAAARPPLENEIQSLWHPGHAEATPGGRAERRSWPHEAVDSEDAWAPSGGREPQVGGEDADEQWPAPIVPGPSHPGLEPRTAGRAATLVGVAIAVCGVALLGWNLMETEGLGEEVLVPMADVKRPLAGNRSSQLGSRSTTPTAALDPSVDQAAPRERPAELGSVGRAAADGARREISSAAEPSDPADDAGRLAAVIPATAVVREEQGFRQRPAAAPRGAGDSLVVHSMPDGSAATLPAAEPEAPDLVTANDARPKPASGDAERIARTRVRNPRDAQADSDSVALSASVGAPVNSASLAGTAPSSREREGKLAGDSAQARASSLDTLSGHPGQPGSGEPALQNRGSGPQSVAGAQTGSGSPSAPSGPSVNPVQERRAVASSYPVGLSSASAVGVLQSFSQHYASGDLSALVALFSSQANSARGGSMALAADYARLFDGTSEREFSVQDLSWRLEGETLRGEGRFEARYYRKGRLFRQVVKGEISFVMVAENGSPRILRLDSRPDGRGA